MKQTQWSVMVAAIAVAILSGCASQQSKPLYGWGDYQNQVYTYFKEDGANYQEQIAALEKNLQKNQATDQSVPPGYHAHLGLLYAKLGQDEQLQKQLETEKVLFPESSSFMDFLLKKFKK